MPNCLCCGRWIPDPKVVCDECEASQDQFDIWYKEELYDQRAEEEMKLQDQIEEEMAEAAKYYGSLGILYFGEDDATY